MSSTFVAALVMLMNAARADVHVPPFREDPILSDRAQQRAEFLCANRQFSHDGWQAAFRGSPYGWSGENLAMGHQEPRADQCREPLPALPLPGGLAHGRSRPGERKHPDHPFPPATTLISLNIGRYMATTMPPTMPPISTIITGSMIDVSVSTAVSTSDS